MSKPTRRQLLKGAASLAGAGAASSMAGNPAAAEAATEILAAEQLPKPESIV